MGIILGGEVRGFYREVSVLVKFGRMSKYYLC